jgi:hypothetical protein
MQSVVLFERDGHVLVLVPGADCGLSLEEIIAKDIPGAQHMIVHQPRLPALTKLDGCRTLDDALALLLPA